MSWTYTNRLRVSLSLEQPGTPAWVQGYDYDAAERLLTVSSAAGTFTYGYPSAGGPPAPASRLPVQMDLPAEEGSTNRYVHYWLYGVGLMR